MRKVDIEKTAIVKALDHAPNITVAAKDLGASRRTLQARMRDHNIPPGQAGRPRTLLPKAAPFRVFSMPTWLALGVLGGAAGAIGLLVYLAHKKSAATVVAGSPVRASVRMTGLDVLGAG